jgi:hypothetical protein
MDPFYLWHCIETTLESPKYMDCLIQELKIKTNNYNLIDLRFWLTVVSAVCGLMCIFVPVYLRGRLISLWLYKENNKLWG